jgi:hypothetical protein
MRRLAILLLGAAALFAQQFPPASSGANVPSAGVVKSTGTALAAAAASDIVGLFGSGSCSGFLKNDGTCVTTPLSVANGGTGTASPGLVAGTNITSITGTWPNQTVNAATQTTTVVHPIGYIFDGGGSALTNGRTYTYFVPFACTIQAWNMTVDTGTATVDIWKVASGTAIPTITNTITASALPAIASGTALHSTTLTGWTTSVSANDIIAFNLNTVASATMVSIVLQCQ